MKPLPVKVCIIQCFFIFSGTAVAEKGFNAFLLTVGTLFTYSSMKQKTYNMKKLHVITFAITALLFVNVSAHAQNTGARNMQKRDQGNQGGQYNQGSGQYNNGNQNQPNDERSEQYNRGNGNEQYSGRNESNGRNNRDERYGRRDDDRRQQGFRIVLSNRGRGNDRYNDHNSRNEYERNCNYRSYHRNY